MQDDDTTLVANEGAPSDEKEQSTGETILHHIAVSVPSTVEQVGDVSLCHLGRFELSVGDVLWIEWPDEVIGKLDFERMLPEGVRVVYVSPGCKPIAIHREPEVSS